MLERRKTFHSISAPWVVAALLSLGYCVGYTQSPGTTFYNAALTVAGWGGAFLVRALAAGDETAGRRWVQAVWAAILVAGLCSTAIALVQYFIPAWADGTWIARPTTPGRAFANLRQPNLLGTLLLMALCAVPLGEPPRPRWAWAIAAVLTLGVATTSSRTALVGLLLLAGWAALDRGMPKGVRVWFIGLLPMAAAWWVALWAYGHMGGAIYFGEARLSTGSDISSSRFKIWANVLQLIADHPWTGVGWGNFNFAWTFSVFSGRPVAFFDHTHNLLLQFAVELGIPLTLGVATVGVWAVWRARGGLRHPDPSQALTVRCCLMALMVLGCHSMLEYPLWYPYFLFPALFALGVYLRIGWPSPSRMRLAGAAPVMSALCAVTSVLMIAGALYAVWDYQRIVQIFAPYGAQGARPLPERIAEGQKSWLFGHHADYAAVTTATEPAAVFPSFRRPLQHLVDARLMIAYAKALDGLGHRDKAVYVVQRLREFRHPLGDEFLKGCADADYAKTAFECDTRPRAFAFEDLTVDRIMNKAAPAPAAGPR